MLARILHVSDLHMGKHQDAEVEQAVVALTVEIAPDVVVASGDLAHRGRREQHERAHAFLRALGPPVLAVPGNHDIPYTFPGRVTRPWAEFERLWETTEPTFASENLHVVGVNSVRPLRQQGGAVSDTQLARVAGRLRDAADGSYRVVVLHHHLIGAPWRAARKRPVSHRDRVLWAFLEAGADLVLAGHVHQAASSERREFAVAAGEVRAAVVSIAPGLGRPRPNRLGEARGLQVYEVSEETTTALTHAWENGEWRLVARRSFPRGLAALS